MTVRPTTLLRSRVFAIGVIAIAVTACSDGSDTVGTEPAGTVTIPVGEPGDSASVDSAPSSPQQPEGFTTIRARITEADGEVCEVCLWLADDSNERGSGLMGVTDLGEAAGMAFRFDEATEGSFYMFQTPTPLSIAWFAPDGAHVGSADMEPCLDTEAGECPLSSPGTLYDLAIEVVQGGLEPLGLVAGSSVELIDGSEAERCPLVP